MPTAYTILFGIIIIVAILTWVIPAGQYEYVDPNAATKEPISGTYHSVEANPQGVLDVALAPISGFYDAIDVALFVLVVGGFLGVVIKTGAIDAGISQIIHRLKGKEKWMVPILMIFFALGGTSYGMAEESIAFYPIILPVFIAAGYDSVTAVSVIMLGAGVGVLGSTVNPFATGIASGFAGVSLGDGILLRVGILVVGEILAILYVMKYAEKVKKDPRKSLVADMYEENKKHFLSTESNENDIATLDRRKTLILALFTLTFVIMIFGVIPFSDMGITFLPTLGWWFGELTALFFVSSVIIGLVGGLGEKGLISGFVTGASDLLGVALIIGISRGITIIMNSGFITDTVLFWGERALSGLSSIGFTFFTYLFYIPLSFLIPSTSGLATLSMPIMAPLGDFANVDRSLIITAYQSASGIVNLVTPTSAVVMGGLAIGRVPYEVWLKHIWKLLIIIMVLIVAGLAVGVLL